MQFQFSFKHMDASPALRQYTEEKVGSLIRKFVTKPIEVQMTFSVSDHRYMASCSLVSGDGFSMQVEHRCNDMYGSVDRLLDKLSVQLKRKKDKLKKHKGTRTHRQLRYTDPDAIDYNNAEIDAADIVAFEQSRRRAS